VRPLRESREFRLLWGGQVVSEFGSRITLVAVPYQIFQLTGSTLAVGLVSAAELVPLLVFALVGGAIADATDRRRMLLITESTVTLTSIGLVVNALLPHPRVWLLYVLAALSTAGFSLGAPAMRSLVPWLVPQEQMPAAMALEGLYGNFAAVAGPAAAGVLIAAIGLPATYLIDVATFAASLVSLSLLPSFPPVVGAERPGLGSLLEGLRFVGRTPVLLGIFLVDTNAMVFGMPSALFPAIAVEHFHGGAAVTGYLFAAPYAGALVASALSGWTSRVHRQGLAVCIAAAAWGAALVAFGYSTALWIALLMLAAAGAADMVSAIFRSTIVFAASPEGMRGRLTGIELAQVTSAPTLGNVEAGVLASLTSVRVSVVSGGIACVVGTGLIALALPALLRYDSRRARPPAVAS
jgi:MFS family permease